MKKNNYLLYDVNETPPKGKMIGEPNGHICPVLVSRQIFLSFLKAAVSRRKASLTLSVRIRI